MTLVQQRAAHALKQIEGVSSAGKYPSYVKSLPATILTNGLGQALAMLKAQAKGDKKDPHHLLYTHMESWLCGKEPHMQTGGKSDIKHTAAPYKGQANIMTAIINQPEQSYLLAQAEALAYLEWLKKFASAYLTEGS